MTVMQPSPDASGIKKHLGDLYNVLEKARIECGIPGFSVAVLHKGELVFAEGFGKRNKHGDPFDAQTLCPIGSATKAFTATAIGEMVAEGKLDWDKTPVNKYLPEFELKDPVLTSQLTFADMLSHRTDLGRRADAAFFYNTESRIDLIKRLRHAELRSKLDSKMNYCNALYAVAGEAAARVAGVPYEDLVREKVLNPLGLNNTGFSPMEMKDRSPNHAMPFYVATFEDAQNGNFKPAEIDEVYMTLAPAGDIYSNVVDLVKWGRTVIKGGELDGKQVLNKENIEETLKPKTIVDLPFLLNDFPPMINYGLGWVLANYKGHTVYHHPGNVWGYSCRLIMFPDDDLVIAQLHNIVRPELARHIQFHIADHILNLPKTKDWISVEAVNGTKEYYENFAKESEGIGRVPERIPDQPPTHHLRAYVGEYSHPLYGTVSVGLDVDEKDDNDLLMFNWFDRVYKMQHHHFDLFLVKVSNPSGTEMELITFRTGADGKVGSLLIDDDHAPWEFQKVDTIVKEP
ncbi:hypothetical protein BGX28_003845 [Mortierella sp. GBA30]|nr:hypothetical protein BGX28_003845 [Mortierella sp. GBA30]